MSGLFLFLALIMYGFVLFMFRGKRGERPEYDLPDEDGVARIPVSEDVPPPPPGAHDKLVIFLGALLLAVVSLLAIALL